MALKDRVLPPELKRLETALKTSGLKVDQDTDTLAFASFSVGEGTRIVGIAQGQFHTREVMANFTKVEGEAHHHAAEQYGVSDGFRRHAGGVF